MSEPSNEELINRLIAELREADVKRRLDAISQLGRLDVLSQRARGALKAAADDELDPSVREAARQVLIKFDLAEENRVINSRKKVFLFVVGFVGWYIVHTIAWGVALLAGWSNFTITGVWVVLIFLNIYGIYRLAVVSPTRMVAWGALSAFAVNLWITAILGMFGNTICFVPPYLHPYGS